MDFILRIPGWLLSLVFVLMVTPFGLLIYGEIMYDWQQRPAFIRSIANFDGMLFIMVMGILFTVVWTLAILVRYCQSRSIAWLMTVPGFIALAFSFFLIPFAVQEFTGWHEVLAGITEPLERFIGHVGQDYFFFGNFGNVLFTGLLATFAAARMTAKSWRDWLWIPLAMLLFPVGVLFIQPRLRRLLDRKSVTETEDHFLDT